GGFGGRGGFG
nr:Chain B, Substrate peptide [synthetic construct]